jgi:hypothetical protein
MNFETFETLVAVICTFAIFSFLFKENPVYRFFEHIFVGLGLGYGIAVAWTDILKPNWWDKITKGEIAWLLLLIPGSMWYFQLSKKNVWISRLIIGFFFGWAAGNMFKGYYEFYFSETGQVTRSFLPLWTQARPEELKGNILYALTNGAIYITAETLNNWIFIIVLLCCISYFFFSFRHETNPILRKSSYMGRLFFMICFGAIFGNTIMARISLLLQRIDFLLVKWLHLIPE